jgi:hypothetical protein
MTKRPTSTPIFAQTADGAPIVEKTLEQLSADVRAAMTAHRMALHSHLDSLRAHIGVERALINAATSALVLDEDQD